MSILPTNAQRRHSPISSRPFPHVTHDPAPDPSHHTSRWKPSAEASSPTLDVGLEVPALLVEHLLQVLPEGEDEGGVEAGVEGHVGELAGGAVGQVDVDVGVLGVAGGALVVEPCRDILHSPTVTG